MLPVKPVAVVAALLILAASADGLDCHREVQRCLAHVQAKGDECSGRCDSRYYDHFAAWDTCNERCRRKTETASDECNRVYDRCVSPAGHPPH